GRAAERHTPVGEDTAIGLGHDLPDLDAGNADDAPLSQIPPPPVAPSLRPLVTVQPLSMIVRMLLLVAPPREALFSASVALSNVRVLVAANALVDAAAEIGAVAGDRTCVQRQLAAVAFVPTVDANSTQSASHRRIDGPGATAAAVIED
ncbi:MAG: hypothetical protein KC432_12735, partial [Thermomicrobiales bacterium]|nr:hypothetical protein [Thermomicrobiales bacterium]